MNGDSGIGMPSERAAFARSIRRQIQKDRADLYERQQGIATRTRLQVEKDVLERLTQDLAACELLLALFASSLSSSRRSTVCDPFPTFLTSEGAPLFEQATLNLGKLPSLSRIVEEPSQLQNVPLVALKLLDWITCSKREGFTLKSMSVKQYLERMEGQTSGRRQQAHSLPTHVFEVVYDTESEAYREFESEKEKYGRLVGYHGSGLENFHSILRIGFDESFARTSSIYGEGIYLSQDLEVARSFLKISEHGTKGFKHMGEKLGVMAACDILLHPHDVRHFNSPPPAAFNPLDDATKPLPKGYIVAKSAKHVRTTFLLVTSEHAPPAPTRFWPRKALVQWLLIIFYLLVLLAIWYYKGRSSRGNARLARHASFDP